MICCFMKVVLLLLNSFMKCERFKNVFYYVEGLLGVKEFI